MEKTKVLVLVKANPSPFAKEIIQYQEEQIMKSIDLSKITMCGIYRFIDKELNYKTFNVSSVIQKVRASAIDQILVTSKNVISTDISIRNDFENFCNYYNVTLIEVSPLFELIDEINVVSG